MEVLLVSHLPFWIQSHMCPLKSIPRSSAGQGKVVAFSDIVGRAGGDKLKASVTSWVSPGQLKVPGCAGQGDRQFGLCLVTLVLQLHQA